MTSKALSQEFCEFCGAQGSLSDMNIQVTQDGDKYYIEKGIGRLTLTKDQFKFIIETGVKLIKYGC